MTYSGTLRTKQQDGKKLNLDLRAANGESLRIRDIRRAEVHLNGHYTPTEMIFVDHLQVSCILGMDYLNQAGIMIDAGERKLIFKNNGNKQNRSENNKFQFFFHFYGS